MKLVVYDKIFQFRAYDLSYGQETYTNVFANKNNKTLVETLLHKKYQSLNKDVNRSYKTHLNLPLGEFLLDLKLKGDDFYKKFLNKNGDKTYSIFTLDNTTILNKKGIYLYKTGDAILYIGRCRDSLKKRINIGYGKITPKNCYKDGQSTNCHLNFRITSSEQKIEFWFCNMTDLDEISTIERQLIKKYQPPWNIKK